MNQLSKRIIAGTMALTMVGAAAPVSSYLGIKTALTASAANTVNLSDLIKSKRIQRDTILTNDTDKTYYIFGEMGMLYLSENENDPLYQAASNEFDQIKAELAPNQSLNFNDSYDAIFMTASLEDKVLTISMSGEIPDHFLPMIPRNIEVDELHFEGNITQISGFAFAYTTKEDLDIYLPETITNVASYIFQNSKLRYVYFSGNKPSFDSNAFGNANGLTVCYPEGDESWVGVEEQFSGYPNVKWQSYKEPSKIDEVPVTALGSNVTINDSLNMNFFMDIPEGLKDTATIMASVNGGEAKELTPVLVDGTKYKVTVENISAKDAAEPIKFYAVDKTDNTKLLSKEFETSIEDYLVSVYEAADEEGNNYPESTKSFVLSILNYCDTAEKYFNLSTTTDFTLSKIDNFADKYALIAKTSSEVLDADNIKNAKTTPDALTNAEKYRYWGSTLLLKSKLALRQYYKAENGADTTGFDGCKSDIELYYFEETNISPTMLDTDINGYSILSYIKQVLSDDSSDASLKNVCTALYNYSEWAKQYQLDLKDDDET